MERTHPTQQDEALRRARLDDHARAVLIDISNRLTVIRPWGAMTEGIRRSRPLAVAERLYGRGPYADEVEATALALMPPVGDITRGEYALILRRAAGKADA
ncbi:hypothetical protein [Streptomyces sp. NPDC056543]|uniref:hypothetical protein n=1 Tax=unclassified Streptomyces TaxID=2593676 RepID=UPI00367AF8A4